MFNFVQTTIINSAKTAAGLPLYGTIKNEVEEAFHIKGFGKFEKECILNIYKTAPVPGVNAVFKFTPPIDMPKGEYQLVFNVKYNTMHSGSNGVHPATNDSRYTFDFFVSQDSEAAEKIVARLKNVISKHVDLGIEDFTVKFEADSVTFTLTDDRFMFANCRIDNVDKQPAMLYLDLVDFDLVGKTYKPVMGSTITANTPAFGDYRFLTNGVMIPSEYTPTGFEASRPVPGVMYTQYIIEYFKNRGVIGSDFVGADGNSITTHSIWVADSIETAFSASLAELGVATKDLTAGSGVGLKAEVTGPTRKNEKTKKVAED